MLRRALLVVVLGSACWTGTEPPPLAPTSADDDPPPIRTAAWRGTCGDLDTAWRVVITASIVLREQARELLVTGTIAFQSRRTRIRLRGPRSGRTHYTLHGVMTEIEGTGTRWKVRFEVEPLEHVLTGRFVELLDAGGEQEMCRFTWRR